MNKTTRRRSWIGKALLVIFLGACAAMTFGVSPEDEAAYRTFDRAVDGWQGNPEYRNVTAEYCILGSRTMSTRLLHISAKRVIIAFRSIPLLPKSIAVSPTSRAHYEDFSRGPLSAYLHLCAEQDVPHMVGFFTAAGRKTGRTDDDLRAVLDAFKMDFPVVYDAGSLHSVSDVLRDTGAARGFVIQEDIGPRLLPVIHSLAAELHMPPDPEQMSPEQQRAVFDRLDGYVRVQDEELWRTKQINDFCSGIWAQVYGPPYKFAVVPVVLMHDIAAILLILILAIFALLGWRRARAQRARAAAGGLSPEPRVPIST